MSEIDADRTIAGLLRADYSTVGPVEEFRRVLSEVVHPFFKAVAEQLAQRGREFSSDYERPSPENPKPIKKKSERLSWGNHWTWLDDVVCFQIALRPNRKVDGISLRDTLTWGLLCYQAIGMEETKWREVRRLFSEAIQDERWHREWPVKVRYRKDQSVTEVFRYVDSEEAERIGDAGLTRMIVDDLCRWADHAKEDPENRFETIGHYYDGESEEWEDDEEEEVDQDDDEDDGEDEMVASGIVQRLREHLAENPCIVLQGPPGTGKTYAASQFIEHLCDEHETTPGRCQWSRIVEQVQSHGASVGWRAALDTLTDASGGNIPLVWEIVQLHPGYAYEDFVRGITARVASGGEDETEPQPLGFEPEDRILVQLAEVAYALGPRRPVILILDEINRCNLAAVLGELILVLEKSKRLRGHRDEPGALTGAWREGTGTAVRLQYPPPADSPRGWTLTLPENLWIIATMNTADRSIAFVDYAIRRRFRFLDLLPSEGDLRGFYKSWAGRRGQESSLGKGACSAAAEAVFSAVRQSLPKLPERLQVGHSYFMEPPNVESGTGGLHQITDWDTRLARRVVYEVLPLLREYYTEGLVQSSRLRVLGTEIPIDRIQAEDSEELVRKLAIAIVGERDRYLESLEESEGDENQ